GQRLAVDGLQPAQLVGGARPVLGEVVQRAVVEPRLGGGAGALVVADGGDQLRRVVQRLFEELRQQLAELGARASRLCGGGAGQHEGCAGGGEQLASVHGASWVGLRDAYARVPQVQLSSRKAAETA